MWTCPDCGANLDSGERCDCETGGKESKRMSTKEMALKMMRDGAERKEAEKLMGKKFGDMRPEERVLAAAVLAAFDGVWNRE